MPGCYDVINVVTRWPASTQACPGCNWLQKHDISHLACLCSFQPVVHASSCLQWQPPTPTKRGILMPANNSWPSLQGGVQLPRVYWRCNVHMHFVTDLGISCRCLLQRYAQMPGCVCGVTILWHTPHTACCCWCSCGAAGGSTGGGGADRKNHADGICTSVGWTCPGVV